VIKMNKKCEKIYTPRTLLAGDIIALTIDENFLALLFPALWDRGFFTTGQSPYTILLC
jgi:hypothetical protein